MEKKSNKKFIAAIASLAMVVCLALGGLIGVLAAGTQTINSSFNVSYSVSGKIAGSVSAKYQYADWNYEEDTIGAFEGDEVALGNTFDFDVTTENDDTRALNAATVAFDDAKKNAVVFTYTFTNVGETNYTVTLDDNAALDTANTNLVISYAKDGTSVQKTDISNFTVAAPAVGGTTTVTVSITMHVENLNYAAALEGTLNWTLQGVEA